MALTAALRAALTILRQSLLTRLQAKLSVVTTCRFLWRVLALPLEFFTQRHAGDIANRVAATEMIASLLSSGIASNALSLMSVLLFAAAMAIYDVPLAVLCVITSLLNVVLLRVVGRRRQELSYRLAIEQGKLMSTTVGVVRTIETIKASGLEDDAFGQWSGLQAKTLNAAQQIGVSSVTLEMIPTLLSGLTVAAILGLGGWRVIQGSLTLGSLVAFQSLASNFSEPFANLVNYICQPADHQGIPRKAWGHLQISGRAARGWGCCAGWNSAKTCRHDRVEGRQLRLLGVGATAVGRFLACHLGGLAGGAGRRLRKRQVDVRQVDLRSLQAVVRRNPV
jgi:ABC-type bacteriocin/lantibiotic exporter with double-glycine peptidase domain